MYSSERSDNQKFTTASSATAPPYSAAPAVGIPVNSSNQTYSSTTPVDAPPLRAQAPGPWSSGLCDCGADVKSCCITCWCPCITFGQISEIVDRGSSSCVANGAIYALIMYFTGCAFCFSCFYRSKMRQQYNLEESPCLDCLLHCFCETCALCQEYRELQSRGFDVSLEAGSPGEDGNWILSRKQTGWQGNVERQNHGVAMPPISQGMTR